MTRPPTAENWLPRVPRSQLHIYPDDAHSFWFQDRTDWVRRVDRFLC